jgi:hypothetical protein
MTEVLAIVSGAITVANFVIGTIHRLQRAYEDYEEAADTLRRLTNTGRSVSVFLQTIESNIANNSAEYPPDFLTWFEEEKTIVGNLANQIQSHVIHVLSLTETCRLHGGLAQAWSHSRMSLMESMLAQQLTLLYHMAQISKE